VLPARRDVRDSLMSADAQNLTLSTFASQRGVILQSSGEQVTGPCPLLPIDPGQHRRFNELQKQIPDISKKMLIPTLRNLGTRRLLEPHRSIGRCTKTAIAHR